RFPQAGGIRARRLALLPRGQAVPRLHGTPPGELHSRGNVRRQSGQRHQRRELAKSHGTPAEPRGVFLSAADCSRQPRRGSGAVTPPHGSVTLTEGLFASVRVTKGAAAGSDFRTRPWLR